jgi:hypothetical protein
VAPLIFGPSIENKVSQEDRNAELKLKISGHTGTDLVSQLFSKVKTVRQPDSMLESAVGTVAGQFYWAAYHNTYFSAVFRTDPRFSQVRFAVLRQPLETKDEKGKVVKSSEQYAYMIVDHCNAVFFGPKDERTLAGLESQFPQPAYNHRIRMVRNHRQVDAQGH